MIARCEDSFHGSLAGPGEIPNRVASFTFSAIIHSLALLLILSAARQGADGSGRGLLIVPIDVVLIGKDKTAEAPLAAEAEPQQTAAAQQPSDAADQAPSRNLPRADALEIKLQALATLHQQNSPIENGPSQSTMLAATDGVTRGRGGIDRVKDLVRAQIERRWGLDLANLGKEEFSIPIHVEMTKGGVVTKAEIMSESHASDPVYRELALSARNAVLLSSPFSLPPGDYQDVIDMVLYLNPRDALR